MSTRNLTCIGCPMGCQLTAELAGGEVVSVRGNTCARGEAYARKECAHPARTVTGTVRCEGGVLPVVSDRTADEVPKEKVFDVARALGAVTVRAPLHIGDVAGEAGYMTMERTGVRPSLDVNGIWGGYIEEGTNTINPALPTAKISMRLVPNQDFRKIAKLFERYFRAIAPRSVKVDVRFLHGGAPYVSPTDLPAYKAA